MTDEDLRAGVAAELAWDPRVPGAAIIVAAHAGVVTLRGSVGSLREKLEAGRTAGLVRGVEAIGNQLETAVPDVTPRDDADLLGDVLNALMLDCLVPMTVSARCREGFVTLAGTAQWHYQRDEAELVTSSVPGVAGLRNEITLTTVRPGPAIEAGIAEAFRRSGQLFEATLSVESGPPGTVVLTGVVPSRAARDEAVAAAWSAPGVTEVRDGIVILW